MPEHLTKGEVRCAYCGGRMYYEPATVTDPVTGEQLQMHKVDCKPAFLQERRDEARQAVRREAGDGE